MLKLLADKGLVQIRQEGRKYIYSPSQSPKQEGRFAFSRVLNVFFGGSLQNAIAAHLSDPKLKHADDLEQLRAVIDDAESTQRKSLKPKSRKDS